MAGLGKISLPLDLPLEHVDLLNELEVLQEVVLHGAMGTNLHGCDSHLEIFVLLYHILLDLAFHGVKGFVLLLS